MPELIDLLVVTVEAGLSLSAALQLADVSPSEAVMVGDSVRQDVEGALKAGMRAVLLPNDIVPSAPETASASSFP